MIINPYVFESEGEGYGYLYNWYAAGDANFAPTDWKMPSKTEYDTMITQLGGSSVAGGKMKETGLLYWNSPNTGADNSSGFSAKGGGLRSTSSGGYTAIKNNAAFWTETAYNGSSQYSYYLYYNDAGMYASFPTYYDYGYSVRLIYTGAGTPTTVTDNDGNEYDVVLIGTQYWTVQNWKCTTLDNGTSIPNVTDNTTWAGLSTLARCAYDNDENNV